MMQLHLEINVFNSTKKLLTYNFHRMSGETDCLNFNEYDIIIWTQGSMFIFYSQEEEEGWKMAESSFVPSINEGTDKYKSVWMTRDEKDNFSQKHDAELIKEEKRKEVEEEIRIQVDELMRAELKNLKAVRKFTLSKDANFKTSSLNY